MIKGLVTVATLLAVAAPLQATDIDIKTDAIGILQGILADTYDLPPTVGKDDSVIDANDDLVVVGARYEDVEGNPEAGAVYVFRVKNNPGVGLYLELEERLVAPDPAPYAHFGYAVATDDGDKIVVGAPGRDVNGKSAAGKAYQFYSETPDNWGPPREFVPEDSAENSAESDRFGYSVAVSGDVVAVGAPYDMYDRPSGNLHGAGRVYVYYRLANPKYGLITETFGRQAYARNGWSLDSTNHFGTNNPTDEHDFLIVSGAPNEDHNGTNTGAVYFTFLDDQSGWINTYHLPTGAKAYDYFGNSVAIRSKMVAIGSPGRDDYGPSTGMVTILDIDDTRSSISSGITPRLHEEIYPTDRYGNPNALSYESFGNSLDLDGDSSEAYILSYNQLSIGGGGYRTRMHSRDKEGTTNPSWETLEGGSLSEDFGISVGNGYVRTDLFTITPYQVGIDPRYNNASARVFLYQ